MKKKFKYLVATDHDLEWGLTVSTVGYEEIDKDDEYPTRGHADGYFFQTDKGRVLDEYQLQYVAEGTGVFQTASAGTLELTAATSSFSIPANGTPTIRRQRLEMLLDRIQGKEYGRQGESQISVGRSQYII